MNVERALFLFGIDEVDKKEIRKRYLRKCREYHPDKHMNASDCERREYAQKFNELQEAYILLNKEDEMAYMMNDVFHKNVFSLVIKLMRQIQSYEFREEHVYSVLDLLDDESLKYIYHIIQRHKNPILEKIVKWIETRISNVYLIKQENVVYNEIYQVNLYPTLYELFNMKLYLLEYDKKPYYIPLWHRHICINNIEATTEPKLEIKEGLNKEYNVYHLLLDDENDLHIYVAAYIDYIFKQQLFEFDVYLGVDDHYKTICISADKITMKKDQTICLKREGIPRMNKQNIYDDKQMGDILVYLQLVL